jgi:hypothetical protein
MGGGWRCQQEVGKGMRGIGWEWGGRGGGEGPWIHRFYKTGEWDTEAVLWQRIVWFWHVNRRMGCGFWYIQTCAEGCASTCWLRILAAPYFPSPSCV